MGDVAGHLRHAWPDAGPREQGVRLAPELASSPHTHLALQPQSSAKICLVHLNFCIYFNEAPAECHLQWHIEYLCN